MIHTIQNNHARQNLLHAQYVPVCVHDRNEIFFPAIQSLPAIQAHALRPLSYSGYLKRACPGLWLKQDVPDRWFDAFLRLIFFYWNFSYDILIDDDISK